MSDFMDESSSEDAVCAVRAALEQCKDTKAAKLVLPGGTLNLKPDCAYEKYLFISNNTENLMRIVFDLSGMKNFEIDGNGTELVFTGFVTPFYLDGCENVLIKDLSIDYTRTFHSEGTVKAVGDGWLDLSFPDDYIYKIDNGLLHFYDENGTVYPYSHLLEFDAEKREPAFHAYDYWLYEEGNRAEELPSGDVRLYVENIKATVGNVMVLGASARYNPVFPISDSEDVTLRHVNIYHGGGMGVIAQKVRNIELDTVNVLPAPGSGRMVSITADATHFSNCKGYIRMIGCDFENQIDDPSNIHGLYMAVKKILGPDKVLLKWCNTGQYGVDYIEPGMTLEIVNNKTVTSYASRTVKAVERLNKEYTAVTFTEELPEGLEINHAVAEDGEYPDVLVSGCRFAGNRARGLLIGSRGHVVVEDCYFHVPGAAILFEGDANYWFEQSGVRDVMLRNNVFDCCNYGSPHWGAACIAVGTRIPEKETSRYHRNITVTGNTFKVFDNRVVNLFCTDGFVFENNTIETSDAYPASNMDKDRFIYRYSDNISICE